MTRELIYRHYGSEDVRREIVEYSRNRWVAVHCEAKGDDGLQIMLRYHPITRKPLTLSSPSDIQLILESARKLRPRTFYASAHTYRKLDSREDLLDLSNMVSSTPTWDIDSRDGDWRKVVRKAEEIVGVLEKEGVSESVYVKWSGRGAHVQINPRAFSREVMEKIGPLNLSYSVTQYVIDRLRPLEGVEVENKIDIQRVFTCPLSIHRTLNRVAVCFRPDRLHDFHISWTDALDYRHDPSSWRRCRESEGDELAEKAFLSVGPYPYPVRRRRRKHKPLDKEIMETFRRLGE